MPYAISIHSKLMLAKGVSKNIAPLSATNTTKKNTQKVLHSGTSPRHNSFKKFTIRLHKKRYNL